MLWEPTHPPMPQFPKPKRKHYRKDEDRAFVTRVEKRRARKKAAKKQRRKTR